MKKYKVYQITNKINGKYYIGYTTLSLKKRFCCHRNSNNKTMPIVLAMKKYGSDNFVIEELQSFKSKEEATSYEIEMIAEKTPHYNIHKGGLGGGMYGSMNGMYGKKHSDEWKKNKSLSMSGSNNPMYGKTHSDDIKRLISESKRDSIPWNKGKTGVYSEEILLKMKKPKCKEHREKLSKTYTFVDPEGQVVSFSGLLTFCKQNGLNAPAMSEVNSGKRKHYKKWTKYE